MRPINATRSLASPYADFRRAHDRLSGHQHKQVTASFGRAAARLYSSAPGRKIFSQQQQGFGRISKRFLGAAGDVSSPSQGQTGMRSASAQKGKRPPMPMLTPSMRRHGHTIAAHSRFRNDSSSLLSHFSLRPAAKSRHRLIASERPLSIAKAERFIAGLLLTLR